MTLFDDWRARSPFYDATHTEVADSVRAFVAKEVAPHIDVWEDARQLPRELHRKAAAAGILGLGYPEGPIELLERTGLAAHHDVSQALFEQYGEAAYAPARRARVAKQRMR